MRCQICRALLPTMKKLLLHYVSRHSKIILACEMMKLSSKIAVPKRLKRKLTADKKQAENCIFSNDNVEILCRNNEIIIRDDKSYIDMEFTFDYDEKQEVNNNQPAEVSMEFKSEKLATSPSSSASSEDCFERFQFKKRIRRKRDTRNYKINITRSKNYRSLNETTGLFYLCHCKDEDNEMTSDVKLTSDTESASETGLNSFCINCGNGYENDNLLSEHMKIYKTYCGVCNKIFPTEELFRSHIETHKLKIFVCHICNKEFHDKNLLYKHFESHVEDSLFESVIDMEEQDYEALPQNVPDLDCEKGLSDIFSYLKDDSDMYSNTHKVYCDICFTEVFYGEYESHVQNMHTIYGFDNNID